MTTSHDAGAGLRKQIEYYKTIIGKMPSSSPFSINAHLKLGKLYSELGEKEPALQEFSWPRSNIPKMGKWSKLLPSIK